MIATSRAGVVSHFMTCLDLSVQIILTSIVSHLVAATSMKGKVVMRMMSHFTVWVSLIFLPWSRTAPVNTAAC